MVATDKLRGIIYERGTSQRKVASALGMTEKTFYSKMKKGVSEQMKLKRWSNSLISTIQQKFF